MHSLIQSWLNTRCSTTTGAVYGVVTLLANNESRLVPIAAWPNGLQPSRELANSAQLAFEKQRLIVQQGVKDTQVAPEGVTMISHPLRTRGRTIGAVAIGVKSNGASDKRNLLSNFQRVSASFEVAIRHKVDKRNSDANQVTAVLELIAATLSHERFAAAAGAIATELATRLQCDRASLGFVSGKHIEVMALSHSATVAKDQALLREIGAAMEECADQAATLVYPPRDDDNPRITLFHAELARRQNLNAVLSVPLAKSGSVFGAITLERQAELPFDPATIEFCEHLACFVGPVLELQRLRERRWHVAMRESLGSLAKRLSRPGAPGLKLGVFGGAVAVGVLCFVPSEYRVSAPARLEGTVQRVLVAPVDGYLRRVHARPGDAVKAGQPLAALADEDLKLEQRKSESEIAQAEATYGEALAKQDRTQIVIQQARITGARSQLAMVEQDLARAQILAPFDGTIIEGDLTRSLGAPVKKGEVLLTLAPSNEYRVIIEVDERDVGNLRAGQIGRLTLAALPLERIPVKVERVTPVASNSEGRHYFEVEARLDGKGEELRPGLRGVAKVEVGERSLLWIWTHRAVEWLSVTTWSWLG